MTSATHGVLCGACFAASDPGPTCSHCGHKLASRAFSTSLAVGTVLDGKFVVGNVLGSPGGFGIAYLGWDRVLQRMVVIKELFPDTLVRRVPNSDTVEPIHPGHKGYFNLQRELFLDEARKLARLDGVESVARVIHYFAQNDTAYFVMPHVPGTAIASRVAAGGPVSLDTVLQWLWPLAEGLQAIHELGLVHRDIKPENVLIDERERPVLIDFGNATVSDPNLPIDQGPKSQFFAVSRCFAAPEQYINDLSRTGPWTDLYALGALVYFCLTGQRPTDSAVRAAGGELPPLASLVPGLPEVLLQTVDACMALDTTQRPQNVAELLTWLEPLRPQAFHWTHALPDDATGQRLLKVHEQVERDVSLPRGFNPVAGVLQFLWFFGHRLVVPGLISSAFLLAGVAVGLWFRVLPVAAPLAWLLAAVPSALFADALLYRRVATVGASLKATTEAQRQQARALLASAGALDARTLLFGFVPPLLAVLMWGVVADYEDDVRYRVRQAVALEDLRQRVAAYVADHRVPPQSLQDVGVSFVANSEVSHLELKAGVIELVLAVKGAQGRRLRWRLDPQRGWVCEARDLQPQYTPPNCAVAR